MVISPPVSNTYAVLYVPETTRPSIHRASSIGRMPKVVEGAGETHLCGEMAPVGKDMRAPHVVISSRPVSLVRYTFGASAGSGRRLACEVCGSRTVGHAVLADSGPSSGDDLVQCIVLEDAGSCTWRPQCRRQRFLMANSFKMFATLKTLSDITCR